MNLSNLLRLVREPERKIVQDKVQELERPVRIKYDHVAYLPGEQNTFPVDLRIKERERKEFSTSREFRCALYSAFFEKEYEFIAFHESKYGGKQIIVRERKSGNKYAFTEKQFLEKFNPTK